MSLWVKLQGLLQRSMTLGKRRVRCRTNGSKNSSLESRVLLTAYFVDAVNGSDTNAGTSIDHAWKTYLPFVSYYAASPNNSVTLQPGDVVSFLNGQYDSTYLYGEGNAIEDKGVYLRNVHGTAAEPITLKAYPGHTPVFSARSIGQELAPIELLQSSYIILDGLEVANSYGGGISISAGDHFEVARVHVHDVDGVDNNNLSGLSITAVFDITVHSSRFHDNYDRTNADTAGKKSYNSCNVVLFGGGGVVDFHDNEVWQTPSITEDKTGGGIKYKHAATDLNATFRVANNIFRNCALFSVQSGTSGTQVINNLIIDSGPVEFRDCGGTTRLQNNVVEQNTLVSRLPYSGDNGSEAGGIAYSPTDAYFSLGTLTVRNNIVIDERTYNIDRGIVAIGTYMSDRLYDVTVGGATLSFSENRYFNAQSSPQFNLFNANGGAYGVKGDSYSLVGWQSLGFDADSQVINPLLDANFIPQEAACANAGWRPTIIPTPEVEVTSGSTVIVDGGSISFGSAILGAAAVSKTFTVWNTGTGDLVVHSATVGAGFTFSSNLPGSLTLAPSASISFEVQMLTGSIGSKSAVLEFSNTDGDEDPFNFTVTGVVESAGVTLDDGQAGYTFVGSWAVASGGFIGADSATADNRYVAGDATADRFARATFSNLVEGRYRVLATYRTGSTNATNASYVVRKGAAGATLGTGVLNQRLVPNDLTINGKGFETIATVDLMGSSLQVELSDRGNGRIWADAFHIERIGDIPPQVRYLDDGDAGFSTLVAMNTSIGGRLNDVRFVGQGAAIATNYARWEFADLIPGHYRVMASYRAGSTSATNANYRVLDGATGLQLGEAFINQRLVADDLIDADDTASPNSRWENIGLVNVHGPSLAVELSNLANGKVYADSIRIERVGAIPREASVFDGGLLITDGGTGTMGNALAGISLDKTFTVRNTGTTALTLQPITLTGAGYAVRTNIAANTVLAPGAETSFKLRFNRSIAGAYIGTVRFLTNDPRPGLESYDFTLVTTV